MTGRDPDLAFQKVSIQDKRYLAEGHLWGTCERLRGSRSTSMRDSWGSEDLIQVCANLGDADTLTCELRPLEDARAECCGA